MPDCCAAATTEMREQMLAKDMTSEEWREQLREWREDGGRHSDEVRRKSKKIYFRKSNRYFLPFFAKLAKQFISRSYLLLRTEIV